MPPRIRTVEGSCWSCKERRVICDLRTPSCEKCVKIGRRCDYGKVRLRWTDCVASRGRLAGKKIPLCQQPVIIKTPDYHMQYFEYELLPRFNIANSLLRLDIKEISKDPLLKQSVVAVANAHSTYRSANESALSLSKIEARNDALKLFRKQLIGPHTDESNHSLFIANVLLCMLDGIIEPVTESSATHHHIIGGTAILKQWKNMGYILQAKRDLPVLMLSIFATMDLTHCLLIGDDPYFDPSTWKVFADCEPWWGNVRNDDDFLEVMSVLSRLARLGNEARHARSSASIATLVSIQMTLEQQAARQAEAKYTPDQAAWAAFCSCFRFTACVYLYRAMRGLDVDHELVQQAVDSCMEIISGDSLTDKLHHCVLFPVLIVGSHCYSKEHRASIKKSLARTAINLSFESIRSLDAFLDKRWLELDSGSGLRQANWWLYFQPIANVTCLF